MIIFNSIPPGILFLYAILSASALGFVLAIAVILQLYFEQPTTKVNVVEDDKTEIDGEILPENLSGKIEITENKTLIDNTIPKPETSSQNILEQESAKKTAESGKQRGSKRHQLKQIPKMFEVTPEPTNENNKFKMVKDRVTKVFNKSKCKTFDNFIADHKCNSTKNPEIINDININMYKLSMLEIHGIDRNDENACDKLLQKACPIQIKNRNMRRVEYAHIYDCIRCKRTLVFLFMEEINENENITLTEWIRNNAKQPQIDTADRDKKIEGKISSITKKIVTFLRHLWNRGFIFGGIDMDNIYINPNDGKIKFGHVTSIDAIPVNDQQSMRNDIIAMKKILVRITTHVLRKKSEELKDFMRAIGGGDWKEYSDILKMTFLGNNSHAWCGHVCNQKLYA